MDLEQLLEIQAAVQQLRAQGHSDAEMNAVLQERGDVRANTTDELELQIQRAEQAQEDVSDAGVVQQGLASISQGITGGFSADLFRMLEHLPGTPDDLDERHVALLERAREEHPILSGVGQVGGAIGGAPGRVGTLLARGMRAGARGASRGGRALAGLLGGGAGAQAAGAVAGGAAGGTAAGVAAGAVEGGAMGAGEARSQTVPATGGPLRDAAQSGATFGGVLGGVMGGAGGALGATRSLFGGTRGRAQNLEDAARRESGLPEGAQVRQRIQDVGEQKSAAYSDALSGSVRLPEDVTITIMKNPVLRRNLERSGSEEAKDFLQRFIRWESRQGIRGGVLRSSPMPEMPAQLADDIRAQARRTADTFRRADLGSDPSIGTGTVRDAEQALSVMDDLLADVPGYDVAQGLARLQGTQSRAWDAAQGAMSSSRNAREVAEELARHTGREAQEAFRVRMLQDVVTKLRGRDSSVRSFLTDAIESPETQDKLKLILGGDRAYEAWAQSAQQAKGQQTVEELAEGLLKYAGFIGAGSSLAGGALVGILGG